MREDNLSEFPRRPSVFRIFDRNDNLILLEKTHNLGARLERFYSESPQPGGIDLRDISDRVEFCRTDSPFETLYLLYQERRQWFPASYRRMRTFPTYHLVSLDPRDRFPRIETSQTIREGIRYFGPFVSRAQAGMVKATAERAFRIRPCEYDIRGDDPYPDCLYFQMETCSRPCNGDIDRAAYARDVERAIQLVCGNGEQALAPLLERIHTLAREMRFEEAEQVRLSVERARKGRGEVPQRIFEVGLFDFAVVLNGRSMRSRKVAIVRGGRIAGIEEHAVDTIETTIAASLAAMNGSGEPGESDSGVVYDEFCLCTGFMLRPVRSVSFFPIESAASTAARISRYIQETLASRREAAKKRTRASRVPDA